MISADVGPALETFVAGLVESGRYRSQADVLRESLRLMQDRESRLAALDAAIAIGLADAEAGRLHDADEVFDELEARYSAMIPDAA